MRNQSKQKVFIRDSTLREGLDTPNVKFNIEQKLKIATLLDNLKVPEIEIIAPGRVMKDLEFAEKFNQEKLSIKTSGLVYAYGPEFGDEVIESSKRLHRFDIVLPVSPKRQPCTVESKKRLVAESLDFALGHHSEVGIGFPHSTQIDEDLLIDISRESVQQGAKRITVYDTNGSADPFEIYNLIKRLKDEIDAELWFHGHNDLGLATANSVSAVLAGADGIDATINGIGDRAGNASLEQVVMCLILKGVETGITLKNIKHVSEIIEKESNVKVSKLAPIIGEYAFSHKSPSHLESPDLFEAYDPSLISRQRKLTTH